MKTATTKKPQTVSEYFAALPPGIKKKLQEFRNLLKAAAPGAEEIISYNMPAFKQEKILVWYAANKNHIGLYPSSSPILFFKNELAGYITSKGAIQFPWDEKIPVTLVKKIVKFRIQEVKKKAVKK